MVQATTYVYVTPVNICIKDEWTSLARTHTGHRALKKEIAKEYENRLTCKQMKTSPCMDSGE